MEFNRNEYFKDAMLIDSIDLRLLIEDNSVSVMTYDSRRENQYLIGEYNIVCNFALVADWNGAGEHVPDFRLVEKKSYYNISDEEKARVVQLINNYAMIRYTRELSKNPEYGKRVR